MSAHLDPHEVAGLVLSDRSDPERIAASEHTRGCAECRAVWDDARVRLSTLDALAEPPPPSPAALEDTKRAVLARMRSAERTSAHGDPEPEVSAAKRGAPIPTAIAIPAIAMAAFVSLALALRPLEEVAWGISLLLLGIVGGRTALALVRGGARSAGFSLALGVGVSAVLVWIDVTGAGEGHIAPCMLVELAAAALPLLAATGLAWRGVLRPSALGFAAIAACGALAGQLALRASCPDGRLEHLAASHFGSVVAAALLGALLASTPMLRRRVG